MDSRSIQSHVSVIAQIIPAGRLATQYDHVELSIEASTPTHLPLISQEDAAVKVVRWEEGLIILLPAHKSAGKYSPFCKCSHREAPIGG